MDSFIIDDLVRIFAATFFADYRTVLVPGAAEPFYQAPRQDQPAKIFARADYFSSALHEIAHWCVAGARRRAVDDFGYWYEANGRSPAQQRQFEQVEVYPQSLEWAFHVACGKTFLLSADNLDQDNRASCDFAQAVHIKAQALQRQAYPRRAAAFIAALEIHYCRQGSVANYAFSLDALMPTV